MHTRAHERHILWVKPFGLLLLALSWQVSLAKTVGWWSMDGRVDACAEVGDVFRNRKDPSVLSAEVSYLYEGTPTADVLPVYRTAFGIPPPIGRVEVPGEDGSYTNSSSIFLAAPANGGSAKGCCVRVYDTADQKMHLDTFTLEGRFRMSFGANESGRRVFYARPYGEVDGEMQYTFVLYGDVTGGSSTVPLSCRLYLKDQSTGQGVSAEFSFGGVAINDDAWHNIGFVFNSASTGGTEQKASLFVDDKWIATSENLGGKLLYNDEQPLLIGGSLASGHDFRGYVDEVRLDDTVIQEGGAWLVSAGSAHATLGWWSMDGKVGEKAKVGDVFLNRKDPSVLSAEVCYLHEGTPAADVLPEYRTAFGYPHPIGRVSVPEEEGSYTNSSSIFLAASATAGAADGCCIRVCESPDLLLRRDTFTLEGRFRMSFKANEGGRRVFYARPYGEVNGQTLYTFILYGDVKGGSSAVTMSAKFYLRDQATGQGVSAEFSFGNCSINDDAWHDIGLLFNGLARKSSLFVDGEWVATSPVLAGTLLYNDEQPLLIGGSLEPGNDFRGFVDEVRLDYALIQKGGAWLVSSCTEGETIAWFGFDGDYSSRVLNDFWTATPVASARSPGKVPAFASVSPKRMRIAEGDGRALKDVNRRCLEIDAGQVLWEQIPDVMKYAWDELTVEFFYKGNPASWASMVRTHYYHNSALFLPWNVGRGDGATLMTRVDGKNSTSVPSAIPVNSLYDGQWHHMAIVFSTKRNRVSYWLDYEKVSDVAGNAPGYYAEDTAFGIGLASTPLVGSVDELRITNGALPVEKFLRLGPQRGLVVFFQ